MSPVLHPNQSKVAIDVGVEAAATASVDDVIDAIETKLGTASMEVRSHWFVISVLRHLRKAKWTSLDDCPLSEKRQRSLTKACIAVKGFTTSLGTVTKDNRSKFRLVGFASSKNIERGMLATGTKAYKIVSAVILEAGVLDELAEVAVKPPKSKSKPEAKQRSARVKVEEKSVVGRRAKRRGYDGDERKHVTEAAAQVSGKNQAASMSEEEFASLDAALSQNTAEPVQQSWSDQVNEDRWSRVLGVLAGVGFFVFIALLFL